MLEVKDASFAYPAGRPLFQQLSLTLAAGQVLCVLGPNGAGKSTLLRCLAALMPVSHGSIQIDGRALDSLSRREMGRLIGFVPQSHSTVFAFTARMVAEMGRAAHLRWTAGPSEKDAAIALNALTRLGIQALADKPYPELSGGERQLVLLARALAQQPRLLILDEPASHLDFANQARVLELLQGLAAEGLAVIMTSHDPSHAFLAADQTLILVPGQPAWVGPTDSIVTEARLSAAYGSSVRIVRVEGRTLCFSDALGRP